VSEKQWFQGEKKRERERGMGRGGFEPPTHGFSVRYSSHKFIIYNGLPPIFYA